MKKYLIGLFIFVSLTLGPRVYAEFAPLVSVISPNNGGESVEVGGKIEIRWESNLAINLMTDVYISDGIHKGGTVRGTNNGALGLIYTLDSNLVPGSNYRACVSIVSETPIGDCSDNPFTIKSSTTNSNIVFSNIHSITNETAISALIDGTIISDGGSPITERGIVWSKGINPTINDNKLIISYGVGYFKGTISGLTPNTDYFVRLFAKNIYGISYSDNMSFHTLSCSYGTVWNGSTCFQSNSSSPISVISPNGGEVFTQGASNRISWSGGKNKIQIGLFSNYNQVGSYAANNNGIVGWIFTNLVNGVNGTSGNWDGISLTDLNGSGIGSVTPGQYKIVAISESDSGNYCLKVYPSSPCNSDISDDFITIKSASATTCPYNMPNPYSMCSNGNMIPDRYDTNGCVTSYKCSDATVIDIGCQNGEIYSTRTGQRCGVSYIDSGCGVGVLYSTTTGKSCSVDSSRVRLTRTWRWGDRGDEVKIIQRYFGLYADGVYGRGTVAKVKIWQIKNGLNPDGSFGPMSRRIAGLE